MTNGCPESPKMYCKGSTNVKALVSKSSFGTVKPSNIGYIQ